MYFYSLLNAGNQTFTFKENKFGRVKEVFSPQKDNEKPRSVNHIQIVFKLVFIQILIGSMWDASIENDEVKLK